MNLTPEQLKEIARFPEPLRALVEAELAAGNAIAAIENGFPAAPCGTSIKLARAVGDARRQSTDAISFYERNNSSYAGEFTTAKRHFFVLEPPLAPPPEPDMDAIRKEHEPPPTPLSRLAERSAGSHRLKLDNPPADQALKGQDPHPSPPARVAERGDDSYRLMPDKPPAARAFANSETPTGWTRVLHFCDRRAPHEVQFALERELMTLFTTRVEDGQLRLNATADVNGVRYDFEIQFIAAFKRENHFTLRIVAAWRDSEQHRDYYRKTSDSWFKSWICDLMPAGLPPAKGRLVERYQQLCEAALNAERHLDSVAAVQRAIVDGVKRGGRFGTSHKEGGTHIYWRTDRFIRSDYGDHPDHKEFTDEEGLLKMLWNFCQFDVTRSAGKRTLPELDAWKLILRRMKPA